MEEGRTPELEGTGGQMELSCEALGSFLKATGMQGTSP